MATQTDLDRLLIAWARLREKVNTTIPNTTDRVWAARNRLIGRVGGGPRPS